MGKFMAKIRNFDSFVGCISTFLPDKREIWHGGADRRSGNREVSSPVPNFTFIGATCHPCGVKNLFLDH